MSRLHPTPPALFRAAELGDIVSPTAMLRRGVRAKTLVRLRRGVYITAAEWSELDRDGRYRAVVRAAIANLGGDAVASHQSAAALWRLPIVGSWPTDLHVVVDHATGGRSDPGVRRHAVGIPELTDIVDGVRVTSLPRTVIHLAATASLYSAIAATDAAIHVPRFGDGPLTTKAELYEEWERMLPFKGHARALRIIEFAETGAGSTSESASRCTIAMLGFPAPQLQRVYVVDGRELPVDFYFEEVDGIGECDGFEKYTNPALRGGRTAEEVVIDEKLREDGLRRQAAKFTRWGSAEAMTPSLLRLKLLEIGLRQGAPRLRGR